MATVTLRKAANLQTQIEQELKGIRMVAQVSLNEFEKPEDTLSSKGLELKENLDKRLNLLAALFDIRKELGNANATFGINGLLTELALIDKVTAVYGEVNA